MRRIAIPRSGGGAGRGAGRAPAHLVLPAALAHRPRGDLARANQYWRGGARTRSSPSRPEPGLFVRKLLLFFGQYEVPQVESLPFERRYSGFCGSLCREWRSDWPWPWPVYFCCAATHGSLPRIVRGGLRARGFSSSSPRLPPSGRAHPCSSGRRGGGHFDRTRAPNAG